MAKWLHTYITISCKTKFFLKESSRILRIDPCGLRAAGGTADNINHTTLNTTFILVRQKPHKVERTQLIMNEMTDWWNEMLCSPAVSWYSTGYWFAAAAPGKLYLFTFSSQTPARPELRSVDKGSVNKAAKHRVHLRALLSTGRVWRAGKGRLQSETWIWRPRL